MNPQSFACLSPLVVIWIVMKLALWLSATNEERNYVRAESKKPHGLMWQMHMQTLTKRKKSMEVAQTIDDALYQYYTVENNLPVPNWRQIKTQTGGYNILRIWDLTHGIDSAILPS